MCAREKGCDYTGYGNGGMWETVNSYRTLAALARLACDHFGSKSDGLPRADLSQVTVAPARPGSMLSGIGILAVPGVRLRH